ncbi:MAG: hypothetical protein C0483_16045 [Pirellula sp.]|nr:hypothetical protein [Pirellula sp.]
MSVHVRYGASGNLTIPLDGDRLIGKCGCADAAATPAAVAGQPFAELESAEFVAHLRQALASPLEFPDLAHSVVVGDHVTIVVEPGVPRSRDIVEAAAEQLIAGGVALEDITVLHVDGEMLQGAQVRGAAALVAVGESGGTSASTSAEQHMLRSEPRVLRTERHDPADRGKLGYLGNTRSGRPVYLNRLLTDADMVVAIGCYRGPESWAYRGVYGALYPTFSDTAALQRFRNAHLLDNEAEAFPKSQQEVELVGWQSGVQATVQVIPGPGGKAAVVAGEIQAVARKAAASWSAMWSETFASRADLVVAALGGEAAQTWNDVGRALAGALQVVDDGGAIALCTELSELPGKAMEALARIDDRDTAQAEIRKVRPLDAFAALMLDRAQRRVRVYFLSKLDPSIVEELGMAPVDGPADVERLATRRKSCIVLCDAQYAAPRVL